MDIERYRGDTKSFSVLLQDSNGVLDLTGCTILLTVNSKSAPTNTDDQLFQLTGTSSTPASGVVTFTLDTDQANNVGYFYHDIQLTDATSAIITVNKGMFVFKQDITKN